MSRVLHIDVAFDFICPWCLIGKRQLQRAVGQLQAGLPNQVVNIAWQGVQLLPQLPAEGEVFAAFYRQRLGSDSAVNLRMAQVREAAASVDLHLDFSRIARMPNTADAHRLFERARGLGSPAQHQRLLERLFAAHFQLGEDLSEPSTLLTIAEDCGYPRAELAPALRRDGSAFQASAEAVSGVPYFVFDGRLPLTGAQPAERLVQGMHQALSLPERSSLPL